MSANKHRGVTRRKFIEANVGADKLYLIDSGTGRHITSFKVPGANNAQRQEGYYGHTDITQDVKRMLKDGTLKRERRSEPKKFRKIGISTRRVQRTLTSRTYLKVAPVPDTEPTFIFRKGIASRRPTGGRICQFCRKRVKGNNHSCV